MSEFPGILSFFLDDVWEPEDALELLRRFAPPEAPATARPYCLLVPKGGTEPPRLVAEGEEFDTSQPPDGTHWLWVLAEAPPDLEVLVRIYKEYEGLADA